MLALITDAISRMDYAILHWINGFARHSLAFDKIAEKIADLDFLNGAFLFIFIWWMWARPSGDPFSNRLEAMRIFAVSWLTIVIARVLQIVPAHRLRPIHNDAVAFVQPFTADPTAVMEHWSSFPSDHAAIYFALATAVWMRYRWLGAAAYLWVFVFGCLTRVYAGYHYPIDIVGGALIGAAAMYLSERLPLPRPAIRLAEWVFSWERRHSASFYCVAVAVTYESISLLYDIRVIGSGLAFLL